MIRINLSPTAKRKVASPTRAVAAVMPSTKVSRGSLYAIVMLLGWVAIGATAWLLQSGVTEDTARLTAQTAALVQEAKKINEKIDEEGLQARRNYEEEVTKAVEMLETKRHTPVYVYHEIANILSTGKQPAMIELEQLRRVNLDPQARLDLDWDAHAVWLGSLVEGENGVLAITGGARDPDDLSEFVKRLRASARFSRVSHPEFEREVVKDSGAGKRELRPGESLYDYYSFELSAQVRYWD